MKWLYDQPVFVLPKKLPDDKDYFEFYNDKANEFISLINDLVQDPVHNQYKNYLCCYELKNNLCKIKFLHDSISNAIKLYYEGYPYKAYNSFLKGLEYVKSEIKSFSSNAIDAVTYNKTWDMFRISVWSDCKYENRKDIFHVPFDKRNNIKTYRYSIPGFPSLYLGNSLYTCFKECGITSLEKPVYLSHFIAKKEIKLFDIGIDINYLRNDILKRIDSEKTFPNILHFLERLICWPLFLACSIFTNHNNNTFKSEYIIPQFLMQAIRDNYLELNIDAIRYLSVRNELDYHSLRLTNNFVFPVKTFGITGYCRELNDHFEWTKPISYEDILVKAKNADKSKLFKMDEKYKLALKENTFGFGKSNRKYGRSDFGLVEKYLKASPIEYEYGNLL